MYAGPEYEHCRPKWEGTAVRLSLREADERIEEAQAKLRAALSDWDYTDVRGFIARHYPSYWLRTDTKTQVEHAELLRDASLNKLQLATRVKTDAFTAITELTVFAPNHPRLLALFAGACAAAGCNIAGAHITTTRDGFALDTFLLNREFANDEDELRRAQRIGDMIDRLLKALSERLTVVEVSGRDRPGLLYDLTSALSDLSLDIASAHVTTFGEKAVDVFYVTDLVGKQIVSDVRQKTIKERLLSVLGMPAKAKVSKSLPA